MAFKFLHITAWLIYLSSTTIAKSAASNSTFCVSQPVSPPQQQVIWDSFVQEWYIDKRPNYINDVIHRYIVEDYIQHNTFLSSGAQKNIDYLETILPGLHVTVYHVSSVEQNLGWVHWRVQGGPTSIFPNKTAIVDMYRFNGSCIVEHWDVIQSVTNTTTNPIALF